MIRQRERLSGNRSRLALAGVLLALSLAVTLEHSGVEHSPMDGELAGEVISMCLAVIGVGGLAVASAVSRRPALLRAPGVLPSGPQSAATSPARPASPARAGPAVLQVFRR